MPIDITLAKRKYRTRKVSQGGVYKSRTQKKAPLTLGEALHEQALKYSPQYRVEIAAQKEEALRYRQSWGI